MCTHAPINPERSERRLAGLAGNNTLTNVVSLPPAVRRRHELIVVWKEATGTDQEMEISPEIFKVSVVDLL